MLINRSCYLSLGGCFVEGDYLRNAFRWKETIGQWEERPGHFGDVWNYWTDDGLGHFEFLQVIFYVLWPFWLVMHANHTHTHQNKNSTHADT